MKTISYLFATTLGQLTKRVNKIFEFCFRYWILKNIWQKWFFQLWNMCNCSFLGMSRNVMLWIKNVNWLWWFHLKSLNTTSKFRANQIWPSVERLYNRWDREYRLYSCREKWPFVKKRVFPPKQLSRKHVCSQWHAIHVKWICKLFSTHEYTW